MGYVESGSTVTLRARLTQRGRAELLSGSTQLTMKFFALGDVDANYRTSQLSAIGDIPDVTGDYSGCTLSLADGVGLRRPVALTGDTVTPEDEWEEPQPTYTETYTGDLKFGFGSPTDIVASTNVLNCDIHLNRMMNLQQKYSYEWHKYCSHAPGQIFDTAYKNAVPGNILNMMQYYGTNDGVTVQLSGKPYLNFYDFIFVEKSISGITGNIISVSAATEYDDLEFEFNTNEDLWMWELINNIYIYKDQSTFYAPGPTQTGPDGTYK